MNTDSFCYAVLLKRRDQADVLLKSLPESMRELVRIRMDELQKLPEAEIRSQWKKLRLEEAREQMKQVGAGSGLELTHLTPRLRASLVQHFEYLT